MKELPVKLLLLANGDACAGQLPKHQLNILQSLLLPNTVLDPPTSFVMVLLQKLRRFLLPAHFYSSTVLPIIEEYNLWNLMTYSGAWLFKS